MSKPTFPLEAIKNFLKHPTLENLEKIRYFCAGVHCEHCVFRMSGSRRKYCPGPYATNTVTYKVFFQISLGHEPTLSEIVLILSEILARYEQRDIGG